MLSTITLKIVFGESPSPNAPVTGCAAFYIQTSELFTHSRGGYDTAYHTIGFWQDTLHHA